MKNRFRINGFNLSKNQFGAVKQSDDGYTFDSTSEWKRYKRLKFELENGNISDLIVHPSYDLDIGGGQTSTYSADFSYVNKDGKTIVEDVKNPELREDMGLKLKLRMLRLQHNIIVMLIHPKNSSILPPYCKDSVDIPDF